MESTKIFDSEITSGPIRRLIEAKSEIDRVLSLLKEGKPKESKPSGSEGEKPKHLCSWGDCKNQKATLKSGPRAGEINSRFCFMHQARAKGSSKRGMDDPPCSSAASAIIQKIPGKDPALCRVESCTQERKMATDGGRYSMCVEHYRRYRRIKKGLPSPPMDAPIKCKESK